MLTILVKTIRQRLQETKERGAKEKRDLGFLTQPIESTLNQILADRSLHRIEQAKKIVEYFKSNEQESMRNPLFNELKDFFKQYLGMLRNPYHPRNFSKNFSWDQKFIERYFSPTLCLYFHYPDSKISMNTVRGKIELSGENRRKFDLDFIRFLVKILPGPEIQLENKFITTYNYLEIFLARLKLAGVNPSLVNALVLLLTQTSYCVWIDSVKGLLRFFEDPLQLPLFETRYKGAIQTFTEPIKVLNDGRTVTLDITKDYSKQSMLSMNDFPPPCLSARIKIYIGISPEMERLTIQCAVEIIPYEIKLKKKLAKYSHDPLTKPIADEIRLQSIPVDTPKKEIPQEQKHNRSTTQQSPARKELFPHNTSEEDSSPPTYRP